MTKNDIAVELANRIPELSKKTALQVVDGVAEIMADAFTRGENVYLRGFGTMKVNTTKERKARNIYAGSTVVVPAQRTVKFKLSKDLKERMNNATAD